MKVRDSGMPEENVWNTFFDTNCILTELQINAQVKDLVEMGSGYGTFTIPAAKRISGKLFAFDFEQEMITLLKKKQTEYQIDNIIAEQRDIIDKTTGLKNDYVDYVMLFNILHNESPLIFFNEAYRILKPGGLIGIIHWRSDIETPRGPDLSIRPKPEQILKWADEKKFSVNKKPFVIKPYHYGLVLSKI